MKKIDSTIQKINEILAKANEILPMYASADITLRFETQIEVKAIAEKLSISVHYPSNIIKHTWCLYKKGPVQIYIQTHDLEDENEPAKKEETTPNMN